ncbi:MAG: hypothetical protein NT079_00795 [Candidatus Omnitrophica bacterium]|nr:hypothetical protein [Candidatus Omnitrophota bacterium]
MSCEAEIDNRIHKSGKGYHDWYVGVAVNPRQRLFIGHNVDERTGAWLYRDAGTASMAKDIEAIFVKKGCKGGDTRGEDSPRYVYIYKMTRTTRGSQN